MPIHTHGRTAKIIFTLRYINGNSEIRKAESSIQSNIKLIYIDLDEIQVRTKDAVRTLFPLSSTQGRLVLSVDIKNNY